MLWFNCILYQCILYFRIVTPNSDLSWSRPESTDWLVITKPNAFCHQTGNSEFCFHFNKTFFIIIIISRSQNTDLFHPMININPTQRFLYDEKNLSLIWGYSLIMISITCIERYSEKYCLQLCFLSISANHRQLLLLWHKIKIHPWNTKIFVLFLSRSTKDPINCIFLVFSIVAKYFSKSSSNRICCLLSGKLYRQFLVN